MINPINILMGVIIIIVITSLIIYQLFFSSKINNNRTLRKIVKVELLLESEKDKFNRYPIQLNKIIRNNPTLQDVIYDYWNNEFFYKQTENGQDYILISKGKDGEINTKDDVRSK